MKTSRQSSNGTSPSQRRGNFWEIPHICCTYVGKSKKNGVDWHKIYAFFYDKILYIGYNSSEKYEVYADFLGFCKLLKHNKKNY